VAAKEFQSVLIHGEQVQLSSSLLGMRLSESVRVPLFESLLPSLQPARWRKISELVASPLVLEILLSHHVQLSGARQFCVARGLLARFLPNFVRRPLLRCSAMSGAMSIKHRHAAHDKSRHSHQHKESHWLEFSGHESG